MTIQSEGILEIDQDRGVIYFHCAKTGASLMRICSLPTPIPDPRGHCVNAMPEMLDLTWGHVTSWKPESEETLILQIFGPDSPEKKAVEALNPSKVRDLAVQMRRKAENYKSQKKETEMIFMDDEADALYLLSISLCESDSRIMEREFLSLRDETQNLLFEECMS